MKINSFILALVLFSSCQKDPVIQPELPALTIAQFMAKQNGEPIDTIYAHAGNHPQFEKETDQVNVHLRFWSHADANIIWIFRNDSIQYADSLELFYETELSIEDEPQGIFKNALIKTEPDNADYYLKVAYAANDTIFTSPAIRVRQNELSTNTKNVRDITVETTTSGRAYFRWSGAGAASENNLIELADATGNSFCAVVIPDQLFLFHNLRNITENFTPHLYDPRLVHGESYRAYIYMTDNAGWMRNYRTFEFVADSSNIYSLD